MVIPGHFPGSFAHNPVDQLQLVGLNPTDADRSWQQGAFILHVDIDELTGLGFPGEILQKISFDPNPVNVSGQPFPEKIGSS